MLDVNFDSSKPQVICHENYNSLIPEILEALSSFNLHDHFILFSSGTSGGDLKGYAVSKEALFSNAKAVNDFFQLTPKDVWGLSLPVYHIGGLSVMARAHLLKNKIIDLRHWNPESWIKAIEGVTITTIVPTQLYDLVNLGYKSPGTLRYLIVGGDFLSSALKAEAIKLGWPVHRTFGMSEVCSQLASSNSPLSDDLKILPIHQVKVDSNKQLMVKSSSLFTLQFTCGKDFKVKTAQELSDKDGFFLTSDLAKIQGENIKHLGRIGDEVKIAGHLVNLNQLKDSLGNYLMQKNLFGKVELSIEADERKGKKLVLMALPEVRHLVEDLSKIFHPVKVDEIKTVESFNRTALGKLKKK